MAETGRHAVEIDAARCVGCGECVADCVTKVLTLRDKKANHTEDFEEDCIGCQHCLAICPVAAISVDGTKPAATLPLAGFKPDFAGLDKLVRGRRSVRRFAPEPVPSAVLQEILAAVTHAPTGVNARTRRFTLVTDAGVMSELRNRTGTTLAAAGDRLPEEVSWLVGAGKRWVDKRDDMIFRNAPHLLVVSADKSGPCSTADAMIAASYFDLLAQARGVGTTWAGMVYWILSFLPEFRSWLDIPESHDIGYALLFGMPAVRYARTALHRSEDIVELSALK